MLNQSWSARDLRVRVRVRVRVWDTHTHTHTHTMEALKLWNLTCHPLKHLLHATTSITSYAFRRAPRRLVLRSCSSSSSTASSAPGVDKAAARAAGRNRRAAVSTTSTSDREAVRAIRLKKVQLFALLDNGNFFFFFFVFRCFLFFWGLVCFLVGEGTVRICSCEIMIFFFLGELLQCRIAFKLSSIYVDLILFGCFSLWQNLGGAIEKVRKFNLGDND